MKIALYIIAVALGVIILALVGSAIARIPITTRKKFSNLENVLLEHLMTLFETDIQSKIKDQIQYFEPKRKYRQYWDKSMSMELYGDTNNPLSPTSHYNRKDESKLATIRFKVDDAKYSIEYNNYNGRIWGWKIRPNPKSIIQKNTLEILSKKINTDPNSIAQTHEKKELKKTPKFNNILDEIINNSKSKQAFVPIKPRLLNSHIQKLHTKLPMGYLSIINISEGLICDEFSILGASEIRTTSLDDGNYFHLVEFPDGIIATKEGDDKGQLYFCDFSGLIEELNIEFSAAIKQINENTTL